VVRRTIGTTAEWQLERIIGKNVTGESAYSSIVPGTAAAEPTLVDCAVIMAEGGDPSVLTFSPGTQYEGKTLSGNYYSATYGIFKVTASAVASGNCTITSTLPPDYGTATNFVVMDIHLPYN